MLCHSGSEREGGRRRDRFRDCVYVGSYVLGNCTVTLPSRVGDNACLTVTFLTYLSDLKNLLQSSISNLHLSTSLPTSLPLLWNLHPLPLPLPAGSILPPSPFNPPSTHSLSRAQAPPLHRHPSFFSFSLTTQKQFTAAASTLRSSKSSFVAVTGERKRERERESKYIHSPMSEKTLKFCLLVLWRASSLKKSRFRKTRI